MLYPQTPNVKRYSIGHDLETNQPKKGSSAGHIFTPLCQFWLKIQNTHHHRNSATNLKTETLVPLINDPANGKIGHVENPMLHQWTDSLSNK